MNKKIKIYELLEMINNLYKPMPKKINYYGYEYEWNNDFQDYLRTDHKQGLIISFLENHDDNLYCFLNDEVEILDDEDMEIEELNPKVVFDKDGYPYYVRYYFDKINEIVREINKLKKEGK